MTISVSGRENPTQAVDSSRLSVQDTLESRLCLCICPEVKIDLTPILLLPVVSTAGLGYGQQVSGPSTRAAAVKKKADHLSAGAQIRVIKLRGNDQYGRFQSDDNLGFTFYDIDRNENVTLPFEDVHKIKNG